MRVCVRTALRGPCAVPLLGLRTARACVAWKVRTSAARL